LTIILIIGKTGLKDLLMNAVIKVCTASKEFRQDQIAILRRVSMVLIEHDLSVEVVMKVRKTKQLNLRLSHKRA